MGCTGEMRERGGGDKIGMSSCLALPTHLYTINLDTVVTVVVVVI